MKNLSIHEKINIRSYYAANCSRNSKPSMLCLDIMAIGKMNEKPSFLNDKN